VNYTFSYIKHKFFKDQWQLVVLHSLTLRNFTTHEDNSIIDKQISMLKYIKIHKGTPRVLLLAFFDFDIDVPRLQLTVSADFIEPNSRICSQYFYVF